MLPSFTFGLTTPQNHIHLGAVPNDGSAPSGFDSDGAPPYKIQHIQKRTPIFSGMQEFSRSWNGTPHDFVLRTSDNISPIIFTGFVYEARVDLRTLDILQHLYLRKVYLVDHRHPADGVNCSSFVRIMYFNQFSFEENLDPMLQYNIVNIGFEDMDTVSA